MKWILIVASLLVCTCVHATTIAEYKAIKAAGGPNWEIMKTYVTGLGEGFSVGDVVLQKREERRFFCQPANLALNTDNYVQLLDKWLVTSRTPSESSNLAIEMFAALATAFPCDPAKSK